MNYAWNIAAAGVITAMYRQDVAANNLANVETAGFKGDCSFTMPRNAAHQEPGNANLPSNALLDRLGGGVLLAPNRVDFTQGQITPTDNPLDVAIQGSGFLTVESSTPGQIRLTRDGRMTIDSTGKLVTSTTGQAVLDSSGQTISLNRQAPIAVDGDGNIRQNGQSVAKLAFTDVPDRRILKKQGGGFYTVTAAAAKSNLAATGQLVQNAVERSSVDPIMAMTAMQNASSDLNASLRVMQVQTDMMKLAVNTFGRVSA